MTDEKDTLTGLTTAQAREHWNALDEDRKTPLTPAYRNADLGLSRLRERVMQDVFHVVNVLLPADQEELVQDYFGEEFYDAYLDWLRER